METTDRYTEWLEGVKFLIYQQKKIRQTELAKTINAGEQHVNAILKGRRKAGPDLQDSISRALGMCHDDVRNLGREALGLPRLVVAAGNYVLPKLRIKGTARVVQNCAGSVVNNGVMSVGDEAPVAPAVSGGEIVKDVSEMIAKYLEGKSLDEQIEFRAEIKRLIVGRSCTNDAAKTPHGGPYMLVTTEFVSPEGPRMMRRDTDCTADMERQKE